MRETLFRGKRIDNGEWVYGYYARKGADKESFRHYICVSTFSSDYQSNYTYPFYLYDYEVDPSTVGQYTGLSDKNGKRIFEGDIVSRVLYIGMGCGEARGVVVYRAPEFLVDCKHNRVMDFAQYPPENRDYEVIGNIHDNPELMEVGE